MTFKDLELERVYQTLLENDRIIDFLKQNNYLVTKKALYDTYTKEQVENMDDSIVYSNTTTLYDLAAVLLEYEQELKSTQMWELVSNKVAMAEMSAVLGVPKISSDVYKEIIYCFKYCTVSSFFQNNQDKFMPENDFEALSKNKLGQAFYDALMKEFDKLDTIISKCTEYLDYDKIPWNLINYLTQILGYEKSTINADGEIEGKFRELAKNILDVYRIKGTDFSYELFFNFLGFNIKIEQYYFDRRLYHTTNSGGNEETRSSNNNEYEYYLTTFRPQDNVLKNIGDNETISISDFSNQYSLLEFNELVKEFGVEAVLGYSPLYPVKNSKGEVIEYKEYTGKVYKYFKTNLTYYRISMYKKNPSQKQINDFTKYLDFLTPSYMMKKIIVETYSEDNSDDVSFGDGESERNGLQILDSEDWDENYEYNFINKDVNGKNFIVDDNKYDGLQETQKLYSNSLGTNAYKLPLRKKIINKSVSKYLTNATGTGTGKWSRVKYYFTYKKNGVETVDLKNFDEITIQPYYTIPPYNGTLHYTQFVNSERKSTKNVSLTGKNIDGSPTVKDMVKNANFVRDIDFLTDLSIQEFVKNSQEFNELNKVSEGITPNLFSLKKRIKYGSYEAYKNLYEAYVNSMFDSGVCNVNDQELTEKNIQEFIPDDIKISNNKWLNSILSDLDENGYFVSKTGDFYNGELLVYYFGSIDFPIKNNGYDYSERVINYLKYFKFELSRLSQLQENETVIDDKSVLTFNNLQDANASLDAMVKLIQNDPEKNNLQDFLNSVYFVMSSGEYYTIVKKPVSAGLSSYTYNNRNHVFVNLQEADAWFEQNPSEKANNAEFFISNTSKLYRFQYKNRRGKLIFSKADEKLYQCYGNSYQDIRAIDNFYGKLVIDQEKAYIQIWDKDWAGYDEEADSEDYIMYNSLHNVKWNAVGMNKKISRPVKYVCDRLIDNDLQKLKLEYQNASEDDKNFFRNKQSGYYETISSRIIREIATQTVEQFMADEKISWNKLDGFNQFAGILSVIESQMEILTQNQKNKGFDYYSSISDFFVDYYNIVVCDRIEYNSFPKNLAEDLNLVPGEIVNNNLISRIKSCYNNAVIEIKNILDKISDNRIYYEYLGTFENLTNDFDLKKIKNIFKNILNVSYSDFIDGVLDHKKEKYENENEYVYFPEKTLVINTLKSKILYLKNKFGKNVKFTELSNYLGKDCYSLKQNNADNTFYDGLDYYYKNGKKLLNVLIEDDFYFVMDSNYNFFLPFRIINVSNDYSLNDYGSHLEYYSEFSELLNNLRNFAANQENSINDFIKVYFYNKLVELYRTNSINDEYPIGVKIDGKKPQNAYPKLTEKLNGKAGTLKNTSTLLSSYNNNCGNDSSINVGFDKIKIDKKYIYTPIYSTDKIDKKYKKVDDDTYVLAEKTYMGQLYKKSIDAYIYVNFYVDRQEFIKKIGHDFNNFYKYLDLLNISSEEKKQKLSQEIAKQYQDLLNNLKPSFLYKNDGFYKGNNFKTDFQLNKEKIEIDYNSIDVKNIDADGKLISNSNGEILDKDANILYVKDMYKIFDRIRENKWILLTVKTPLNDLSISDQELENIYGFLNVKKLSQKLIDNYVSIPKSISWIPIENNEIQGYKSFGDDRSVDISITNKYFYKNNDVSQELIRKYINAPAFDSYVNEENFKINPITNNFVDANGQDIKNLDKSVLIQDQETIPQIENTLQLKKTQDEKIVSNKPYFDVNRNPVNPISNPLQEGLYEAVNYTQKKDFFGNELQSKLFEYDGEKFLTRNLKNDIKYDHDGNLILLIDNYKVHSSKIDSIKIFFDLIFVIIETLKIQFLSTIYKEKIRTGIKIKTIETLISKFSGKISVKSIDKIFTNATFIKLLDYNAKIRAAVQIFLNKIFVIFSNGQEKIRTGVKIKLIKSIFKNSHYSYERINTSIFAREIIIKRIFSCIVRIGSILKLDILNFIAKIPSDYTRATAKAKSIILLVSKKPVIDKLKIGTKLKLLLTAKHSVKSLVKKLSKIYPLFNYMVPFFGIEGFTFSEFIIINNLIEKIDVKPLYFYSSHEYMREATKVHSETQIKNTIETGCKTRFDVLPSKNKFFIDSNYKLSLKKLSNVLPMEDFTVFAETQIDDFVCKPSQMWNE